MMNDDDYEIEASLVRRKCVHHKTKSLLCHYDSVCLSIVRFFFLNPVPHFCSHSDRQTTRHGVRYNVINEQNLYLSSELQGLGLFLILRRPRPCCGCMARNV